MRASGVVGDSRKIGARPCAPSSAANSSRFLGRIVDDQHAVDAGVVRARSANAAWPIASIGLA